MSRENNQWLEKYEIKKPDYDIVNREHVGMKDAQFEPSRYIKKRKFWVVKKLSDRFKKQERVRLMFLGDITCFDKQIEEAQNGNDYDFSYEFEKVKPIFEEADLVVGNLETMIVPDAPYRTEKFVAEQNFHCNAPIEFLDAIRKSGVDVLTNANNHDMDTGAVGIGETIDYVERFGFIQTGTFKSDKKRRYELINVKGFKIAIVAFATEHNNKRVNLTQEGVNLLLNDYSKEKASDIILKARKDGAKLVFVCIHWGKENVTTEIASQERIAKELSELGYDCIIGSHPHVLQPYSRIVTKDKTVPVFFSMGNFVSHNADNIKARSIIACVDLQRHDKEISLNCSYIPIYTSKCYGEKKYVVLPISNDATDSRNIKKENQIANVIGNEIERNTDIQFDEYIERMEEPVKSNKNPKPNLKEETNFPIKYDNGKFVYSIFRTFATIETFSNMNSPKSYSVPAQILNVPVKELNIGAFEGNSTVKKINFSKNISVISERLCKNCVSLEGFQLGNGTKEIGKEAFAGCINLSSAVMKNNVIKIDDGAFKDCVELRSVKLPNSITYISNNAFDGCEKAVFYCEKDSYAEKYAKSHGFDVIIMKLD